MLDFVDWLIVECMINIVERFLYYEEKNLYTIEHDHTVQNVDSL